MGINLQWICQWPFGKQSWYDFTVVNLTFETGSYKGRYGEMTLIVLGLGFTAEIYDKVDRAKAFEPVEDKITEWIRE